MTMVIAVAMVLGVIGLTRMPVNLFPEVSMPVVTAIVPYPGAGPAEVEDQVVRPIEDAVAGIEGLKEIYSTARESVGIVVVVFDMGAPLDQVSADFRDRVLGLRAFFPDGVDEPIFRRIDPAAAPILTFAVASEWDPLEVRTYTERFIKPRVEQIDGVGAVTIQGGEQREIQVELDLPKMAELRIPLLRVVQLLGYDTLDIPGGNLDIGDARLGIRSSGQVEDLEELGSIVVQGFPQPIYLRDIAHIIDGRRDRSTLARVDGRRAVTFDVIKESGANTVAVADAAREAVEELDLPVGVTVQQVVDTSDMVRDMSHELRRSLFLGALMAILVVYLFMVDVRSTLISGLALPTSVITTFFFIWIAGFSINMLTLLAMALAIGILIDDAVVVREVTYRYLERGEDKVGASLKGTGEVWLAVLATTSSILAVFIPVGFIGGVVGQFFSEFGLTIAIAVAVSFFIAFTVDPMLSSRIGRVIPPEERGAVARAQLAAISWLDDAYRGVLAWGLDHGKAVIAIATVLFVGSLGMAAITGSVFIPAYDRSQFEAKIDLPPSTGLLAAEQKASELEALIRQSPEVEHIYTVVGPDGATDRLYMRVLTSDKGERDRSIYQIQDEVRERLSVLPGMVVSVQDPPLIEGGGVGRPVEVELRGDDMAVLGEVASQLRAEMSRIEGAVGVQTTYRSPRPELQLDVDRDKAASAGLSVGQAGIALRMAVEGQVVGSYREGEESYDIRVRARQEDRTPRKLLAHLLLLSPLPRLEDPYGLGTPVGLQDIARLTTASAPSSIRRHDRQRFYEVSCELAGRPLSDVVADTKKVLQDMDIPEGVEAKIEGEAEFARDALANLLFALVLAIIFVYAVLASQFESFIHPFTIMLSLPLAVVGAFATIFLVGWPIGIPTMLGIILLMGLVTKNAILLVDRANQFLDEGLAPREAMLEAGHLRLRPILMTTLAMILGMAPAAFLTGSGSEISQPMALPVIGGLVASTLLTLLVVPVVYLWMEQLRASLGMKRRTAAAPVAGQQAGEVA
jgi:CzcA family heavy metal efflux pump